MRARLCSVCVIGDCGWSVLGSQLIFPVRMRCACCERRLSSSEVMSFAGCSRSVIRMHLVVVIAVSLSWMYFM